MTEILKKAKNSIFIKIWHIIKSRLDKTVVLFNSGVEEQWGWGTLVSISKRGRQSKISLKENGLVFSDPKKNANTFLWIFLKLIRLIATKT